MSEKQVLFTIDKDAAPWEKFKFTKAFDEEVAKYIGTTESARKQGEIIKTNLSQDWNKFVNRGIPKVNIDGLVEASIKRASEEITRWTIEAKNTLAKESKAIPKEISKEAVPANVPLQVAQKNPPPENTGSWNIVDAFFRGFKEKLDPMRWRKDI